MLRCGPVDGHGIEIRAGRGRAATKCAPRTVIYQRMRRYRRGSVASPRSGLRPGAAAQARISDPASPPTRPLAEASAIDIRTRSQREGQNRMNDDDTIRQFELDPANPAQARLAGIRRMTEEEWHAAALADPDSPPATETQLRCRAPSAQGSPDLLESTISPAAQHLDLCSTARRNLKCGSEPGCEYRAGNRTVARQALHDG